MRKGVVVDEANELTKKKVARSNTITNTNILENKFVQTSFTT